MLDHRTDRIVVDAATMDDVGLVAPLFDAYRQFYGATSDVGAARAFLTDRLSRGESVVLVARVDGDPTGFAQLYRTFTSLSLGTVVVLNDLFVAPHARGRGVASALVDRTIVHARFTGALRVDLATQHTNATARRLYESRGFVVETEFAHLGLSLR